MIITQPMNVGYRGSGWTAQYQIYHFYTYSSTPNYIHFKTNVSTSYNDIVVIEAQGYNYGAGQAIRCAWHFYAWNNSVSDRGGQTMSGSGMSADGVYKSSDGYACIRAYASSHYYNGFILNSYSNLSYASDVSITAASQNSTSGAYY